jgi:hypothetical protein
VPETATCAGCELWPWCPWWFIALRPWNARRIVKSPSFRNAKGRSCVRNCNLRWPRIVPLVSLVVHCASPLECQTNREPIFFSQRERKPCVRNCNLRWPRIVPSVSLVVHCASPLECQTNREITFFSQRERRVLCPKPQPVRAANCGLGVLGGSFALRSHLSYAYETHSIRFLHDQFLSLHSCLPTNNLKT